MQDNINEIIANSININKDSLKDLKNVINNIKTSLNNKEALDAANAIDEKNNNGFIMNFNVINNIFTNIEKENMFYGDVTLSKKDDDKVYGKELLDVGTVVVITDGNPYTLIEMSIRNIMAGNTTIFVNDGYMLGTNKLLITIIQSVLEKHNISKNLVQLYITENYEEVLNNFANIDLVIAIGDNNLQRSVLSKSKNKTITSGYENFDLYIEDNTHLDFINSILNLGLNIQVYVKDTIKINYDNSIEVRDLDEAILHINMSGNKYSSSIFTTSTDNASKFIKEVKSSYVTVNTSPTIERLLDIKQRDLVLEKTIIYPVEFKFDGNNTNINL